MKILLHGGNCCGIKHICSLGFYPHTPLAARKPSKRTSINQMPSSGTNDMRSYISNRYRNEDFFCEKAPEETCEKRFGRFVNYIKEKRSHGIIEVVINGKTTTITIFHLNTNGFPFSNSLTSRKCQAGRIQIPVPRSRFFIWFTECVETNQGG
jgi:hypothetical protein